MSLDRADRVAFTGNRNRAGKKDYTGAFRPEAQRFAGRVVAIDLGSTRTGQRAAIEAAIRIEAPIEVGFFCHGLRRKVELGFDIPTVDALAAALAAVGCRLVALHACSTGADPTGGFAARLRDAMLEHDLDDPRVLGSTTAGHASKNPHRRLFRGPAGTPGEWFVEPGKAPLWKRWCARMRADDDPLRWQLLEREPEDIRAELAAG